MSNFIPQYAIGIAQLGPGCPILRDLLVTGDNLPTTNYAAVSVWAGSGTRLKCDNVSCWGTGGTGFYAKQSGNIEFIGSCSACACGYGGFLAAIGASMRMSKPVIATGNYLIGVQSANQAAIYMIPGFGGGGQSQFQMNQYYGMLANDGGEVVGYEAITYGNGQFDVICNNRAECIIQGGSGGYVSPSPNVMGNNASIIPTGSVPPGPF